MDARDPQNEPEFGDETFPADELLSEAISGWNTTEQVRENGRIIGTFYLGLLDVGVEHDQAYGLTVDFMQIQFLSPGGAE